MAEMRNNYDKKVNHLMQQILDKDDEIAKLRSELRENMLYHRSTLHKSPDDVNFTDQTVLYKHNRSLTPSGLPFMHSHSNSLNIHPNPITDSISGSLRSSLIFNNLKPTLPDNYEALENASRIECRQCYSLLNPNDFYNHIRKDGTCAITENNNCQSPLINRKQSPVCTRSSTLLNQEPPAHIQRTMQHSHSANKQDFAYGNIITPCEYSHLEGRKCSVTNNSFQKLSGTSISTCIDDGQGLPSGNRHKKTPSVPQSLQNSLSLHNKSINDRLDNTESLLKKINKKFDNIFKDGPKINIDISRAKKYIANTTRDMEGGKGKSKEKYNGKMKNLIKKIMMGRSDHNDGTDNSSSCKSQERTNENTTFRLKEETKDNRKNSIRSRYDKIEEESSYANSGSLNSSVNTDSVKMPKGKRTMTINKEITFYGRSDVKENCDLPKSCKLESVGRDITQKSQTFA